MAMISALLPVKWSSYSSGTSSRKYQWFNIVIDIIQSIIACTFPRTAVKDRIVAFLLFLGKIVIVCLVGKSRVV